MVKVSTHTVNFMLLCHCFEWPISTVNAKFRVFKLEITMLSLIIQV